MTAATYTFTTAGFDAFDVQNERGFCIGVVCRSKAGHWQALFSDHSSSQRKFATREDAAEMLVTRWEKLRAKRAAERMAA